MHYEVELAGAPVEYGSVVQQVRVEEALQGTERLIEFHQLIFVGPLVGEISCPPEPPEEVGRAPSLERGRDLRLRSVGLPHELDVPAGLGLERGDQLLNGLVLLGVPTLLPPDDEVSTTCAWRCQHERGSEEDGADLHGAAL
jgi:hypothetical protein